MKSDEIIYSESFNGDKGNWNQPVRYDIQGGYVGVSQYDNALRTTVKDRVLLTPKQIKELISFVKRAQ